MKIARIFPAKNKHTPDDKDAYSGAPDLFTPYDYDEAHISVVFTWHKEKAAALARQWKNHAKTIRIGGPAYDDPGGEFTPGLYVRNGITYTSRGCPGHCSFCYVPRREGGIRELEIKPGNIIQDNNLLACSPGHIKKVFEMLKTQKQIQFIGGIDALYLKAWHIEAMRVLSIKEIWIAYDSPEKKQAVKKAIESLRLVFKRDKIRCYVLIGQQGDTIDAATERLKFIYDVGALPFAQRYRTLSENWNGTYLYTSRDWNLLQRQWTRPAIIKSIMKNK